MSAAPILFDDFQPGALLGERVEIYDDEQVRRWQTIFGEPPAGGDVAEGAGMAVVNMMRAWLKVVAPRPPGNIHARQQLRMRGVPERGEAIRVVVHCADKEMRRGRRYVDLRVQGTGRDGRALFDGVVSLIWAA